TLHRRAHELHAPARGDSLGPEHRVGGAERDADRAAHAAHRAVPELRVLPERPQIDHRVCTPLRRAGLGSCPVTGKIIGLMRPLGSKAFFTASITARSVGPYWWWTKRVWW